MRPPGISESVLTTATWARWVTLLAAEVVGQALLPVHGVVANQTTAEVLYQVTHATCRCHWYSSCRQFDFRPRHTWQAGVPATNLSTRKVTTAK